MQAAEPPKPAKTKPKVKAKKSAKAATEPDLIATDDLMGGEQHP
jgi:hypothetical protein